MLVLITGGAGFIGSHTADALVEQGHEVRVLDNLQKPVHLKGKPTYLNPQIEYIWGDVRDREVFEKALTDVEVVYHFAAYQDYLPDFSTFFHVNSVGTALLYEIIVEKKLKVKKVVVASSQFVQGEGIYRSKDGRIFHPERRTNDQLIAGAWDFLDETGEPLKWQWTDENYANPPNQYAMSKYSQELMALSFGERYDIPSVAMRYSIVQGARQSFYNAYSGACRIFSLSYHFDKAPVIYEDGNMCRDFINVKDVVNANLLVLEREDAVNQVYCVGGGHAYTVLEFANSVAEVFGHYDLAPVIPGKYRFGDTRHACSSIDKIKKLGWSPQKTIIDSIKEYKNYLEDQLNIEDILEFSEKQMKKMNVVRETVI